MPRNLVLFDLEWNIGYKPFTFNYHGVQQTLRGEIIEIGAVKIDEDANVLDTFSIHLRPRIFRSLQHHIAKVTGLTQEDLDKGEPILQGLRRFMKWCGPDAEFAEWGLDDVPVLKQNLFPVQPRREPSDGLVRPAADLPAGASPQRGRGDEAGERCHPDGHPDGATLPRCSV